MLSINNLIKNKKINININNLRFKKKQFKDFIIPLKKKNKDQDNYMLIKEKKNLFKFLNFLRVELIINYYLRYISILKNSYFLIVYKFFICKYLFKNYNFFKDKYKNKQIILRNYKLKKKLFFTFKSYILPLKFKNFFFKNFKIFNYYYLLFNKKYFFIKNTFFKLFPKYRNFFILFYNYIISRVWSVGLFINNVKLKQRLSVQRCFISFFLKKYQKWITRNIVLFISKFTNKFIIFIKQLKSCIKFLNKKLYKLNYIKFFKFIFLIKFKTFEKKGKNKPRKRKAYLKKKRKYLY